VNRVRGVAPHQRVIVAQPLGLGPQIGQHHVSRRPSVRAQRGNTGEHSVGQQPAQLRGGARTLGPHLAQPALDPVQQLPLIMLAELDLHLAPGHGRGLLTHGARAHVVINQFRE